MLRKLLLRSSGAVFVFLLLSLPLGIRKHVFQFTPGFHEYEAIFVYASDVFLALFVCVSLWLWGVAKKRAPSRPLRKSISRKTRNFFLALFVIASLASIFFAPSKGLALYDFARLVFLIGLAVAAGSFLGKEGNFKKVLVLLAVLAVAESVIGFLQFRNQENLGLQFLGESPVGVADGGTSKIFVEGVRVMRAYGTFPHPNILSAFLFMGLISLFYMYLKNDHPLYGGLYDASKSVGYNFRRFIRSPQLYIRILLAAGIFLVMLGIALTFSRAAWGTGFIIGILFAAGYFLCAPWKHLRPVLRLVFLGVVSAVAVWCVTGWAIAPRAHVSRGEPAVRYRLSYNQLGFDVAAQNPFGVGIGNQVLYSVENGVYQKFGMEKVSEWQPIHNIYILIAAETGWLGILGFVGFLSVIIWQNFKNRLNLERLTALLLLASLLLLGLFDHFLWTIEQGRLMLWLVIGFAIASARADAPWEVGVPTETSG